VNAACDHVSDSESAEPEQRMEPGDDMHGTDTCSTPHRARTFVIRIWFESHDGERGPMRGTLSRLGGPVIGAFQSMAELAVLLERALGEGVDAPPAGRRRI
jgi:hypothetical protein